MYYFAHKPGQIVPIFYCLLAISPEFGHEFTRRFVSTFLHLQLVNPVTIP